MSGKEFKKQNKHKHKRIKNKNWRKPVGKHSDVRLNKKHAPAQPKPGYRTDKETRGLHPSGYEDKIVNNPSDLEELDPETEAARINSQVGKKKRQQILEKAENNDIKVLNHSKEQEGEEQ